MAYLLLFGTFATAQQVEFEEFDLDNGLHVITNLLALVLPTFLNIFYLKALKILRVANGLPLCLQTEVQTMRIRLKTELIITRFSHQTV